jgi:uncharacterized protein YegP (UPF0339 family)
MYIEYVIQRHFPLSSPSKTRHHVFNNTEIGDQKMIQLADQWKFYQDKDGQWQWRKFIANKVVAVSFDGFPSRKECIWNAGQRGYIAPPQKAK